MKKVTRCGLFQTVHVQCVSKKAAPINYQKLVDICGHELQPNLQKKRKKDLTAVKIFQKVLGGYFF